VGVVGQGGTETGRRAQGGWEQTDECVHYKPYVCAWADMQTGLVAKSPQMLLPPKHLSHSPARSAGVRRPRCCCRADTRGTINQPGGRYSSAAHACQQQ
jgi:hypothetical protein